jgi:hypothetical protein
MAATPPAYLAGSQFMGPDATGKLQFRLRDGQVIGLDASQVGLNPDDIGMPTTSPNPVGGTVPSGGSRVGDIFGGMTTFGGTIDDFLKRRFGTTPAPQPLLDIDDRGPENPTDVDGTTPLNLSPPPEKGPAPVSFTALNPKPLFAGLEDKSPSTAGIRQAPIGAAEDLGMPLAQPGGASNGPAGPAPQPGVPGYNAEANFQYTPRYEDEKIAFSNQEQAAEDSIPQASNREPPQVGNRQMVGAIPGVTPSITETTDVPEFNGIGGLPRQSGGVFADLERAGRNNPSVDTNRGTQPDIGGPQTIDAPEGSGGPADVGGFGSDLFAGVTTPQTSQKVGGALQSAIAGDAATDPTRLRTLEGVASAAEQARAFSGAANAGVIGQGAANRAQQAVEQGILATTTDTLLQLEEGDRTRMNEAIDRYTGVLGDQADLLSSEKMDERRLNFNYDQLDANTKLAYDGMNQQERQFFEGLSQEGQVAFAQMDSTEKTAAMQEIAQTQREVLGLSSAERRQERDLRFDYDSLDATTKLAYDNMNVQNRQFFAGLNSDEQRFYGQLNAQNRQFYEGLKSEERRDYANMDQQDRQFYEGLSSNERIKFADMRSDMRKHYSSLDSQNRQFFAGLDETARENEMRRDISLRELDADLYNSSIEDRRVRVLEDTADSARYWDGADKFSRTVAANAEDPDYINSSRFMADAATWYEDKYGQAPADPSSDKFKAWARQEFSAAKGNHLTNPYDEMINGINTSRELPDEAKKVMVSLITDPSVIAQVAGVKLDANNNIVWPEDIDVNDYAPRSEIVADLPAMGIDEEEVEDLHSFNLSGGVNRRMGRGR